MGEFPSHTGQGREMTEHRRDPDEFRQSFEVLDASAQELVNNIDPENVPEEVQESVDGLREFIEKHALALAGGGMAAALGLNNILDKGGIDLDDGLILALGTSILVAMPGMDALGKWLNGNQESNAE
ncbi:hypothetical protein HOI83_02480 [Candidatus Uhrbacteria bacterium]|jgi:hypothetical protein|nr:hypothetical protein [Candidatus Uhrbacteria bacterium]